MGPQTGIPGSLLPIGLGTGPIRWDCSCPCRTAQAAGAASAPGYASAVGARWDAVTFFIGSLFFTVAGFLTYREAIDAAAWPAGGPRRRFFVFQPLRIDWWATAVQLAGTLYL